MRRTNIEIDDALLKKAMQLTGARSKREVVDIALRRLIQTGNAYRALRRLRGKLAWDGDVNQSRLAAERRLVRARGDLLALGRPLRVPPGKTSASRKLAKARAHER